MIVPARESRNKNNANDAERMKENTMDQPIRFTEHQALNGKCVVQVTLNAERSLNALNLKMIDRLAPRLAEWETDERVAAVLLDGAGDRAFCAGGDVRSLYRAMSAGQSGGFCEQFFTREYRLDYGIHCFTKPIICWGNGIVMGGGLGLMAGANYRVVTESSRIAMPEVSIGFFPDVGGTWFLNRMPGRIGLFLALTASALNAADARYVGLADRYVLHGLKSQLLDNLCTHDWGETLEALHHGVNTVLRGLEQRSLQEQELPGSQVLRHFDRINALMDHYELTAIVGAVLGLKTEDRWLRKAQQTVRHGSPAAMAMIARQLKRGRHLSLKEVFVSELDLAVNCTLAGELAEGVRALLIDKDGKPEWRYGDLDEVDPTWLEGLFVSPWSGRTHPLDSL
jgi:enoyl-CoA hydratase/carnithine racemase